MVESITVVVLIGSDWAVDVELELSVGESLVVKWLNNFSMLSLCFSINSFRDSKSSLVILVSLGPFS